MEKKLYIAPTTENINAAAERLMIVASPGIGGDFEDGMLIDSKEGLLWEDEDNYVNRTSLWDD